MSEHKQEPGHGAGHGGGDLAGPMVVIIGVALGLGFLTSGRSNEPPAAKVATEAAPEEKDWPPGPPPSVRPPYVPMDTSFPKAAPPSEAEDAGAPAPTASDEPAAAASAPAPPEPAASAAASAEPAATGGGEFSKLEAMKALAKSGGTAARCRQGGAPPGSIQVVVTFAPDGSVKAARVNSPEYVGSPTGKCVLEKITATRIPAFSGGDQTTTTRVQVF